MPGMLPPIHPGEILLEEFMNPLGLAIDRIAGQLNLPLAKVADLIEGRRPVTADIAVRLGRYFGTTPEFWMNLQTSYNAEVDA